MLPRPELRAVTLYLRIFGVVIEHPNRMSFRRNVGRYAGRAVALGGHFGLVFYLILFWPSMFRIFSLAQYVRVILNLINAIAHVYSYYLLVKFERELFDVALCVETRKSRTRAVVLLLLTVTAFVSPACRGVLSVLREIDDPMQFSNVRVLVIVMYTPMRVLWHTALLLYLFAILSLFDEIELFRQRLRSSLDVASLPVSSILFKEAFRRKLRRVNEIFSFVALQTYFKVFKASLITVAMIVIRRGSSETLAWLLPAVHYTLEVVALSYASSLVIKGLQSCTDAAFDVLQLQNRRDERDVGRHRRKKQQCSFLREKRFCAPTSNDFLMSELKTTLDFDEVRDSLTIFDIFVLSRSTTVTFLAGMVSLISIILQFDYMFSPIPSN